MGQDLRWIVFIHEFKRPLREPTIQLGSSDHPFRAMATYASYLVMDSSYPAMRGGGSASPRLCR